MKKILILTMLSAGILLAATVEEKSNAHIKAMREDGSITNVVNTLITDGTFCQIRGHQWKPGCGYDGCLVNHWGPTRHCAVCGLLQVQYSEWK